MSTTAIKLKGPGALAVTAIAAVLVFVAGLMAARWLIGATVASRAQFKEIGELATVLAPADPQTHLVYGSLLEKTFFPDDLPRALREYETAVALSPADHNLWLELGKARARSGDGIGAEEALRHAVKLAPSYARVNWTLGNFLLRQNKTDEAFSLVQRAAESDPLLATPAVTNAWQVFGGDMQRMRSLVGDSLNMKASLAAFLAREKRFEESAEIWRSLPESDRNDRLKPNGEEILREMLNAKQFRSAAEMSGGRFRQGALFNGGFETPLTLQGASDFEWRIADGTDPQIAVDASARHEGNFSLVLIFNSSDAGSYRRLAQTVAVVPGRSYVLSGFYRADMKQPTTIRWSVTAIGDDKEIGRSEVIAQRAEWTAFSVAFTVPASTDGISVSVKRGDCQSAYCPLNGRVWFDDLKLSEGQIR